MATLQDSQIVQPYLNAEIYRNNENTVYRAPQYDYIKIHKDGAVLVGCSDLTGRNWFGAARICASVQEFQNLPKQNSNKNELIDLSSGTADGCFFNASNKVLIGEDSGSLSIWERIDGAWGSWALSQSVSEHDHAVMALQCLEPDDSYVSTSADGNIKIWDLSELICVRSYRAGHLAMITDVSVQPDSTRLFVTSSIDRCITLWDKNSDFRVQNIYKGESGVRCVSWFQGKLLFGDEAGCLWMMDLRNPGRPELLYQFPAPVHRIIPHPSCNKVAVCCDNRVVTVLQVAKDKARVDYASSDHGDYVRGLAWAPDAPTVLYAATWDSTIRTHNIQ